MKKETTDCIAGDIRHAMISNSGGNRREISMARESFMGDMKLMLLCKDAFWGICELFGENYKAEGR